jgi:hypothetical protein
MQDHLACRVGRLGAAGTRPLSMARDVRHLVKAKVAQLAVRHPSIAALGREMQNERGTDSWHQQAA